MDKSHIFYVPENLLVPLLSHVCDFEITGQDFISTYEQKKLIVHADSQITPTASAHSPPSLVICPLPTHPTQFLQNVALFS